MTRLGHLIDDPAGGQAQIIAEGPTRGTSWAASDHPEVAGYLVTPGVPLQAVSRDEQAARVALADRIVAGGATLVTTHTYPADDLRTWLHGTGVTWTIHTRRCTVPDDQQVYSASPLDRSSTARAALAGQPETAQLADSGQTVADRIRRGRPVEWCPRCLGGDA